MDKIVAKLNTIDGIEFTKDAWVNKAPDNYGVVSLSGEAKQLWADGHLTDSAWTVVVTAYVADDNDGYPALIQEKLEALEDEGVVDLTHTNNRAFDFEIGKVRWQWMVIMYGPLQWEEPAPTPPAENAGE
jgi:hypothetical protein